MLEMLFSRGEPPPQFPDSGPGVKSLKAGDTTYGFFGEVASFNMDVNTGLMDRLHMSGAVKTSTADSAKWLKFYYKDKVLFYPTSSIATVTYRTLMDRNMTFNATLSPPDVPTTLPFSNAPMYKENAIVRAKDGSVFRTRLMRSTINSFQNAGGVIDATSEFYDLVCRIFSPGVPSTLVIKYPKSDLPVKFLLTETNTGPNIITASTAPAEITLSAQSNLASTAAWLPVLELIPKSELDSVPLALENLTPRPDTLATYVSLDSLQTDLPLAVNKVVTTNKATGSTPTLTPSGIIALSRIMTAPQINIAVNRPISQT